MHVNLLMFLRFYFSNFCAQSSITAIFIREIMFKILLLFLTIVVTCSGNINTFFMLQSLFKNTYKPHFCFYIVADNVTVSEVTKATLSMNVLMVIQEYFDDWKNITVCELYHVKIIVTENVNHLQKILTNNNTQLILLPAFSCIIVNVKYDTSLVRNLLKHAVVFYAVHVVIVKYLETNSLQYYPIENSEMNIDYVELLDDNIVLDTWNNNSVVRTNMLELRKYASRTVFDIIHDTVYVSAFDCAPFFMSLDNCYAGPEYMILKHLTNNISLKMNVYPKNLTNIWIIPSRDLTEGKSDIALCSSWLNIETYQRYTTSVAYTQMCITFLAPKPRFLFAMYVFSPLDSAVWLYLLLVTLVLMFVLYFCALVYRKLYNTYPSRYVHFVNCMDDILRILLQVSVNEFPSQMLLRCIMLLWVVASMWIVVSYVSGVTSLLTQPIHSKPINTLEDMVTENIHWGFMSNWFINMTDSTLNQIGLLYDNPNDNEVRNKRLRTGQYAALMRVIGNNFVIDTETSFEPDVQNSLRVLQECVFNFNIILKLRRNSPLKYIVDRRIYQILESGLYSYWENEMKATLNLTDMFQYFTMTGDETYNKESPLTIRRMQGLFYLLFTGLSLSIIVFIIEMLYNITD